MASGIDASLKNWWKEDKVIEWDVHHYYGYLPLFFIHHDLKIEKYDYKYADNKYHIWYEKTPEGKKVIKTYAGLAYVYAPFFVAAHFVTDNFTSYEPNGFTPVYKFFLLLSAVVFFAIGLIYCRRILRLLNFTDTVIAATLVCIGVGTNLLAYASSFAPMPHVYNFALVAMFVYYCIQWHNHARAKHFLLMAAIFGLMTVIRPTLVLVGLFFLVYGAHSKQEFYLKWTAFFRNKWYLLLAITLVLIWWIPQFLYWKHVTGHYIIYAFGDERFYFLDPKILDGLFSFRKGWFVYAPVLFFATMGIVNLYKRNQRFFWPFIVFFVINIYVTFSWWCWWYGGGLGQRSLIDGYSLMLVPLAFLIEYIAQKRSRIIGFGSVGLFLIWLNVFQIYQYEHGALHWDGMTQTLYFKQFGKLKPIPDYAKYIDWADYDAAKYRNKTQAKNN